MSPATSRSKLPHRIVKPKGPTSILLVGPLGFNPNQGSEFLERASSLKSRSWAERAVPHNNSSVIVVKDAAAESPTTGKREVTAAVQCHSPVGGEHHGDR